jgi:hypothetical protein
MAYTLEQLSADIRHALNSPLTKSPFVDSV